MAALSNTLSPDAIEYVHRKISDGQYASESDLFNDVIARMREEEGEFEQWIRNVALPSLDRLRDDPSRALSLEQVEASLAAQRLHRNKPV